MARFKKWFAHKNGTSRRTCNGKYQTVLRNICVIGVELLPDVTRSAELFANKLDIKDQPVALQCLHDWIWDRVLKEYRNPDTTYMDVTYYRNLYRNTSSDKEYEYTASSYEEDLF